MKRNMKHALATTSVNHRNTEVLKPGLKMKSSNPYIYVIKTC